MRVPARVRVLPAPPPPPPPGAPAPEEVEGAEMMFLSWLRTYDCVENHIKRHQNQIILHHREKGTATHTSKQDLLQPLLAIRLGTRENMHIISRVFEVVEIIGGLDGEDEGFGCFVEARDVVGVEVRK